MRRRARCRAAAGRTDVREREFAAPLQKICSLIGIPDVMRGNRRVSVEPLGLTKNRAGRFGAIGVKTVH